jgi:hypothetical protein
MRSQRRRILGIGGVFLVAMALALTSSCGNGPGPADPGSTGSSAVSLAPDSTDIPVSETAPGVPLDGGISAEDAEAVRATAASYWDAYNAYDADTAASYLAEDYRPTIEQTIRGEISQIKAFGVTLGVTEKTPPALIGPDEAEIYLNMQEPIGTRTILMRFARSGDEWVITYSQEVK